MENSQEQTPQQHSVIATPSPAQKFSTPHIFLGALFFLSLGTVGGYFFANSAKPVVVEKTHVGIVPSLAAETSNQPSTINNFTIKPINEKLFEQEIIRENECGQVTGMVQYSNQSNDGRTFNVMSINNFSISASQEAKDDLQFVSDVLDSKRKLTPYENIGKIDGAFRASCAGYYILYVKELPGITYPGTDKVKSFITLGGHDLFGLVGIQVLAKAGDDFIHLTKNIDEIPQHEVYRDSCYNPHKDTTHELIQKAEDCYRKKIASDTTIEESAISQAKELIALFRIK